MTLNEALNEAVKLQGCQLERLLCLKTGKLQQGDYPSAIVRTPLTYSRSHVASVVLILLPEVKWQSPVRGYFYLPEEKKLFVGLKIAIESEVAPDCGAVCKGNSPIRSLMVLGEVRLLYNFESSQAGLSTIIQQIAVLEKNCLSIAHADCAERDTRRTVPAERRITGAS